MIVEVENGLYKKEVYKINISNDDKS